MMRFLKKKTTWMLICFLIIVSVLWAQNQTLERLNRSFDGHDVYRFSSGRVWDYSQFYENLSEKEKNALKMLLDTQLRILEAHQESDVRELTKQISMFNLLAVRQTTDRTNAFDKFVYEKRLKPIWQALNISENYETVMFPKDIMIDPFKMYIISKLYSEFYLDEIEPKYSDEVDVVTFSIMYSEWILPFIGIVIAIFVSYASINGEINNGIVKLLLTQTLSRNKYYTKKYLNNIMNVLFIIIVPYVLVVLFIGLNRGFTSFEYPIFAVKSNTLLTPYYDVPVRRMVESISLVPANGDLIFHPQTTIVSLIHYLVRVNLVFVFFISFMVSIFQLISAKVSDQILSFSLCVSTVIVMFFIREGAKMYLDYNILPFEVSKTALGVNNATVIGSILIFGSGLLVVFIIGKLYFNRKSL